MFHEINSLNLKLVFDLDLYLRSNFYFSRMMNILSVKNAFNFVNQVRKSQGQGQNQGWIWSKNDCFKTLYFLLSYYVLSPFKSGNTKFVFDLELYLTWSLNIVCNVNSFNTISKDTESLPGGEWCTHSCTMHMHKQLADPGEAHLAGAPFGRTTEIL